MRPLTPGLLVLVSLLALASGCADASRGDATPAIRAETQGATAVDRAGYAHTVEKSRFRFGGTPVARAISDAIRYEGPEGAALIEPNTAFSAVPNAGAPSTTSAFTGSAEDHNAAVRDYLTGAGLPADQIQSFGVGTSASSSGGGGSAGGTTFGGYTTSLGRALDGIRVVESIATVVINGRGEVVQETVYWPPIGGEVVAAATRLQATLADNAAGADLRSRLSAAGVEPARAVVVIHHAPATGGTTGAPLACIDAAGASVRHFDANGDELRLPQEIGSTAGNHP